MTNINLNKHLLVKAHAKMWATTKRKPKGAKNMRVSSDDTLFTPKSKTTIEKQIDYYKNENTTNKSLFDKNKTSKGSRLDKLLIKIDKQFNEANKRDLSKSFYEHVKTPDDIAIFSLFLIGHLDKIVPQKQLTLYYFLQTAISYTLNTSPKEECNFESLIEAAVLLQIDTVNKDDNQTFFDFLLEDTLNTCIDKNFSDTDSYYKLFCKHRTKGTPKIILKQIVEIAKKYAPPHTPS